MPLALANHRRDVRRESDEQHARRHGHRAVRMDPLARSRPAEFQYSLCRMVLSDPAAIAHCRFLKARSPRRLNRYLRLSACPASSALYVFVAWAVIALRRPGKNRHSALRACASFVRVAPPSTLRLSIRSPRTLNEAGINESGTNQSRSHRSVILYTSDLVRVPAAIGFFKPAIIIPTWALQELSPDELKRCSSA